MHRAGHRALARLVGPARATSLPSAGPCGTWPSSHPPTRAPRPPRGRHRAARRGRSALWGRGEPALSGIEYVPRATNVISPSTHGSRIRTPSWRALDASTAIRGHHLITAVLPRPAGSGGFLVGALVIFPSVFFDLRGGGLSGVERGRYRAARLTSSSTSAPCSNV